MTKYVGHNEFEHGKATKVGVLVCNLGTPEAPTADAVRRYLGEFLSDPRVVEIPRLVWLPILHGIILRTRPRRSAAAYEKIWTDDGSPLLAISQKQTTAIENALASRYPSTCEVVLAMRYGSPSIAEGLERLAQANVRKILVLPLYPQYAAATSASVLDAVSRELNRWRWVPAFRFISDYHQDDAYIDALANSLTDFWAANGRGKHLVMSFHGIPKRSLLAGDPYFCQCHASARLLAERLQLDDSEWTISFQSRFGRAEWLQPYTEASLKDRAAAGDDTVDVICPGFAADCLETLEEIAIQYAETFRAAGGKNLRYVPALNHRNDHIVALTNLIARNLSGWSEFDSPHDQSAAIESQLRAGERAEILKSNS